jgi:hypothetical protein
MTCTQRHVSRGGWWMLACMMVSFSTACSSSRSPARQSSGPEVAKAVAKEGGVKTGYASVNALRMYYEIRGSGPPLVVLHGGFMNIDAMGPIVPLLATSRQVIAVELEGHGRTADLDRPLSMDQMADDVSGCSITSESRRPTSSASAWAE